MQPVGVRGEDDVARASPPALGSSRSAGPPATASRPATPRRTASVSPPRPPSGRRSGVWIVGCPKHERSPKPWSSVKKITTFGGRLLRDGPGPAHGGRAPMPGRWPVPLASMTAERGFRFMPCPHPIAQQRDHRPDRLESVRAAMHRVSHVQDESTHRPARITRRPTGAPVMNPIRRLFFSPPPPAPPRSSPAAATPAANPTPTAATGGPSTSRPSPPSCRSPSASGSASPPPTTAGPPACRLVGQAGHGALPRRRVGLPDRGNAVEADPGHREHDDPRASTAS